MRKVLVVLAAMLLASTALAGTDLVRSHLSTTVAKVDIAGLSAKLTALYGNDAAASYVGSGVCLACHNGNAGFPADKSTWHNTVHSQMLRRPLGQWTLQPGMGVIANQAHAATDDFMVGLNLSAIGAFSAYGANAPTLSYTAANDTYWMTIGTLQCQVVATVAGSAGQGQRYLLRVPVTDTPTKLSVALYYAPATYDPVQGWQPASGWYDSSYNPKFGATTTSSQLVASGGPSSHTRSCVGCHVTGVRSLSINAAGEAVFQGYVATVYTANDPMYVDYNGDGNLELTSIGCEACHGPGAAHVLGGGDITKIVNPNDLTGAQANEICGRCHINAASSPNKTWSWPYHDDSNTSWIPLPASTPWVDLSTAYTFSNSFWGDGVLPASSHSLYEYTQFVISAHGTSKYGINGSSVACFECHDLHDAQQEYQIVTSRQGEGSASSVTMATSATNDTLCLSCHVGHTFPTLTAAMVADFADNRDAIGDAVSAHTNHPFAPERMMGLSNCVTCHMSPTGGHTFIPTRPQDTLTYATSGVKTASGNYVGYPNACADSCHNTKVNIFGLGTNPTPTNWTSTYSTGLATVLQTYYGPGGTWWNTTPAP